MRRGWILLLLLAALALPVSAADVLEQERQILQVDSLTDPLSGQTREALEDYSPASQTDPASAILDIFKWASNLSVGGDGAAVRLIERCFAPGKRQHEPDAPRARNAGKQLLELARGRVQVEPGHRFYRHALRLLLFSRGPRSKDQSGQKDEQRQPVFFQQPRRLLPQLRKPSPAHGSHTCRSGAMANVCSR